MRGVMLQKIENAYLAILRFIIIAVAGLSLLASLFFGISSALEYFSKKETSSLNPKVNEQTLIQNLIAETQKSEQSSTSNKNTSSSSSNVQIADENLQYYERINAAVQSFVEKTSSGSISIDKNQIISLSKKGAESFKNQNLTTQYAKDFADIIEKTLSNNDVIEIAKKTSTLDVLNELFSSYEHDFRMQIKKHEEFVSTEELKAERAKLKAVTNFYFAGGFFGGFLLIVFMSIIVRIERNLRFLEVSSKI